VFSLVSLWLAFVSAVMLNGHDFSALAYSFIRDARRSSDFK